MNVPIPMFGRFVLWLAILVMIPEAIAAGETDPLGQDPDYVGASPGLFVFALFAIIVMLILIGMGLVLGFVACGLAAALVGLGMVSASAVYGLARQSPVAGFRALFLLCGAFGGLAAGVGVAYLVAWIMTQPVHHVATPLIGGFAGLTAGLLIAGLFNLAWTGAVDSWKKKRARATHTAITVDMNESGISG